MVMRNLSRNVLVLPSLAPAARTASATGTGVDLRGFDSAMILVSFGTCTDGTHTPSVQHSMDNSTYTNVSAGDLDGAFSAATSASGGNAVQAVGYVGTQRYVRVVMTVSGATTGALSSAVVVAGTPRNMPTQ